MNKKLYFDLLTWRTIFANEIYSSLLTWLGKAERTHLIAGSLCFEAQLQQAAICKWQRLDNNSGSREEKVWSEAASATITVRTSSEN